MPQGPFQYILAAYPNEEAAQQAYDAVGAKRKDYDFLENAALIYKDEESKIHLKETADSQGGKGAAAGGIIGGILGLVTGPGAILVGAAGAAIGGVADKMHDAGIKDDLLRGFGADLHPGTAAVLTIIEQSWVNEVQRILTDLGGKVVTDKLDPELAKQLEAAMDEMGQKREGSDMSQQLQQYKDEVITDLDRPGRTM
jgi:uncharacterized membrane protein